VLEELLPGFPIPEGLLIQVDKLASKPKLDGMVEELLMMSDNYSRAS
jgi:hypothetical protein